MDKDTTYISFRYDYNDQDDNRPFVITYGYFDEHYKGIYGVENHNKYGEEIKKHFHFNFEYVGDEKQARKFIEKTRKRIQRNNPERGRGYYSLVIIKPDCIDRFFRYPLKQYTTLAAAKKDQHTMPDGYDLNMQWTLSNEEYERDKIFLSSRREKADRRQTTYELIILTCIEKLGHPNDNKKNANDNKKNAVSKEQIFDVILDYYEEQGLPVERLKIRSMIDSLSIKYGLMTKAQYFDIVMK